MITRLRYPKGYQFFDSNGIPLALGNLYYYVAGTTTLQDTYSDSAGTVTNSNPIVLDGSGRLDADIYLGSASDYKEVLTSSAATISPWPDDNILRAVQIDWNAASGPSQILNKPVLAAVATSGSYTDLSNTPPTNAPFTGDSGSGGTSGLVPAPATGDALANKFLSASGGWATPPSASGSSSTNLTVSETASSVTIGSSSGTGIAIPAATSTTAGVLDNARAAKIDGLATVATSGSYADLANKPGVMSGATSTAGGLSGFVPTPSAGQQALFLRGDATWAVPSSGASPTNLTASASATSVSVSSSTGTGATIPAATSSSAGVLDSSRAAKIDGLATVATSGSYNDLSNKPAIPVIPGALAGQNIDNVARLGIGTADTGNALSVNAASVLFSSSADMRATISKGSPANVAAFNFQDNFSTRAQFGLIGNDSFTISTSPDGSSFNSAIVANNSGAVSFPNTPGFTGDSGSGGTTGLVPAPAAGTASAGKFLKADGTWSVPPGTASAMTGATASVAGASGLVPVPLAGQQTSFLRGDGAWATPGTATSPGGSSGQLQYNNGGTLGGSAGLVYGASGTNLGITAQNATDVPLGITGAASQSANLFQASNSSGTALAYIDSGGTMHATNYQALETSAGGWTLSARTAIDSSFPVPVFAPLGSNLPLALDICPSGNPPSSLTSGNGNAWIDVCNSDVRTTNGAVNTARIGNFGSSVEFGSRAYSGAAVPVVNLTFGGTTVASLQSGTLFALPSGNKLLIGATSAFSNAGALEINGGTTYTNELGAINIHTGTNAQPELIAGVDNANSMAYLQSASRNTNLTGFPLKINPNGGAIAFGNAGAGVNSSGAFVGSGALLTGTTVWKAASYSASVPLNDTSYMPQQTVASVITFSPASSPAPQPGGTCYLRLVADGSHVPVFSGFKQDNESKSYLNNAGALNKIWFWYDGADSWYSISQQVAVQPNFVSAQIANASPNVIAITLASTLNTGVVPAASAFSVSASGGAVSVSSVALSGSTVSLTLSRNIAAGETVTVSYTAPGSNALIDSTNTYQTASFSGQSVTNNVASAPTVSSAQIANANPNIIAATFSAALNGSSAPAGTAFSVSASGGAATVSSVSISGAVLSLTLSRNIAAGETVTFSYVAPGSNPLQNGAGTANVASFSGQSVTDNVSSGNSVLRFATLVNITETSDPTFGYDYAATSPGTFQSAKGVTSTKLPASTDGYAGGVNNFGGGSFFPVFGLCTSTANNGYASMAYGIYAASTGYLVVTAGAGNGAPDNNSLVPTNGDQVRIRRSGTSVFAEVSQNGGSSWTTIKTWTGDSGNALYASCDLYQSSTLKQLFSSSNWA